MGMQPPGRAILWQSLLRSAQQWASNVLSALAELPPESQTALVAGSAGAVAGGIVVSVLHRPGVSLLVVCASSLAFLVRWVVETLRSADSRKETSYGAPGRGGCIKTDRPREWWWVRLHQEAKLQAHTGDNSEPSESCTADGQQHENAGAGGEAAGGGELDSAFERLMRLVLRDFVEARPEPSRLRPGAPHANRRSLCAQRWFSNMISDDGEFASHVASLLPHVKAALLPRLRAISPERLARSLAAVVALAHEHLRCLELAHLHVRLTTQPAADQRAAAEPRVGRGEYSRVSGREKSRRGGGGEGSAGPDDETICAAYVRAVRHPVPRALHPGASSLAGQASPAPRPPPFPLVQSGHAASLTPY